MQMVVLFDQVGTLSVNLFFAHSCCALSVFRCWQARIMASVFDLLSQLQCFRVQWFFRHCRLSISIEN